MNIVWIRNDLRTEDNPALSYALSRPDPCIVLFVWPEGIGKRSQVWLKRALDDFKATLEQYGVDVVIRKGEPEQVIKKVIAERRATGLFWNRSYEPKERLLEKKVSSFSVECQSFPGNVLFEPDTIATSQHKPFQVFTPFYNLLCKLQPEKPCLFRSDVRKPVFVPSDAIEVADEPGLWNYWDPTSRGRDRLVAELVRDKLIAYEEKRNEPALNGVSRLSPYLHFGQLSVRSLWYAIQGTGVGDFFLRELVWREFAIHLLYHFPDMQEQPLDRRFLRFAWQTNPEHFGAWCKGMTGYPMVDAGMRELKETGWMHNRVRMIVASFLVKHLLISWKEGAEWFMQSLVDADVANNTMNWQWVAGCGPDAAPYFRIFNPTLQAKKFDPEGHYIKRFVPELAHLSVAEIHEPWHSPGCAPLYPVPIVQHDFARKRALAAFAKISSKVF